MFEIYTVSRDAMMLFTISVHDIHWINKISKVRCLLKNPLISTFNFAVADSACSANTACKDQTSKLNLLYKNNIYCHNNSTDDDAN